MAKGRHIRIPGISSSPYVDRNLKFISTTTLRGITNEVLRSFDNGAYVLMVESQPRAVLLPYETYLQMQDEIEKGKTHDE